MVSLLQQSNNNPNWYEKDYNNNQEYFCNKDKKLDLGILELSLAGGEPPTSLFSYVSIMSKTAVPTYMPNIKYESKDEVTDIFNRLAFRLDLQLKDYNIRLDNQIRNDHIYINEFCSFDYKGDKPVGICFDYGNTANDISCLGCWLYENRKKVSTLETMFFALMFPGWIVDFVFDENPDRPKSIIMLGLQMDIYKQYNFAPRFIFDEFSKTLVIDKCNVSDRAKTEGSVIPLVYR